MDFFTVLFVLWQVLLMGLKGFALLFLQLLVHFLGYIPGTPISNYKPAIQIESQEKIRSFHSDWKEDGEEFGKSVGEESFLFAQIDNEWKKTYEIQFALVSEEEGDFIIRNITFADSNGEIIYSDENAEIKLENSGYLNTEFVTVFEGEISKKWFYKGNSLTLTADVEHNGEIYSCVFDCEVVEEYNPTDVPFPSV